MLTSHSQVGQLSTSLSWRTFSKTPSFTALVLFISSICLVLAVRVQETRVRFLELGCARAHVMDNPRRRPRRNALTMRRDLPPGVKSTRRVSGSDPPCVRRPLHHGAALRSMAGGQRRVLRMTRSRCEGRMPSARSWHTRERVGACDPRSVTHVHHRASRPRCFAAASGFSPPISVRTGRKPSAVPLFCDTPRAGPSSRRHTSHLAHSPRALPFC